MECPRGSICTESEHTVKTLWVAKEWWGQVREEDLPVRINKVTAANGRVQISIRDKEGKLIHKRG